MTEKTTKQIEIEADGRSLGRVATEVATALMGKDDPSFQRHLVADVAVVVKNASKLHISQKKMREKTYTSHSSYPGSLKKEPLGSLIKRRGYGEVVQRAVRGMLPANKLRSKMLKNLVIED